MLLAKVCSEYKIYFTFFVDKKYMCITYSRVMEDQTQDMH